MAAHLATVPLVAVQRRRNLVQELLEVGDEFLARVAFVHEVEEEEAVAVEEVLVFGGGPDDASRLILHDLHLGRLRGDPLLLLPPQLLLRQLVAHDRRPQQRHLQCALFVPLAAGGGA